MQAKAAASKVREFVQRPIRHPDYVNCSQAEATERCMAVNGPAYIVRPHKTDPCRLVLTLRVRLVAVASHWSGPQAHVRVAAAKTR